MIGPAMSEPTRQSNEAEKSQVAPHLTIDPRLLEILVCPISRTMLEYDKTNQELISRKARLAFPLRDGIPIMIEDEARRLTD
jgi:uncharacterized protein